MALTQQHRNIAISTPLGDDVLVVSSVSVMEQLGRLFRIEAELYGTTDVKFDAIVGQNATFRVEMGQGRTRYFNGIVSRFVQTRVEGRHTRYQATFVPWLWFLTRTADCRIFQLKSTPDILGEVFKGHGFSDFRLALSGSYPKWEYCVQYRETDFNFVSRLMEQAGIYYFFEHENGKHTLVLADAEAAHKPMPGYGKQIYRPVQEQKTPGEYLDDWVMEKNLVPGLYAHTDFDFENPKKSLRTNSAIVPAHAQANFEIFDYPGEFKTSAEGEATARVRIEELHADHEIFRGHSNARGLAVGATFTLAEHPRPDLNRGYLVTTASYHITGDDAEAGRGGSGGEFFSANLTAIDATRPFRPARITPKPIVQGLQTAMVVGPSGEEIHTDKYGRVKVQFFWDRYGKANENSSCWIRVSQGWAGKKWGAIYIPRIGQEVIVEFLEGDPDRPIVTGRVYNGDAMPPYDLPAEKTKSTLKSNTTKGGNGFNEIRFEDKKGQEQIFVHGQRDLDVRIRDDIRETNYGHREIRVGWEKDGQTGGNLNTLVRKDVNTHVKGGQFEEVEKQLNQTVKEDVVEDYQKNQSTFVKETLQLNAKEIVIEGATAIHEKSGKISIEGAQSVHIKGATVAIEGSSAVSLKVGGNFVSVSPAGVAIKGSLVLINSGGAGVAAESPKAAVAAEIQAPIDPRPADTGRTGEVTKTSASPITAIKRMLTSQKAPPYVPLAITGPIPVVTPATVPGTASGVSECHLKCVKITGPEGKRNVTANLPPTTAVINLKPTDKRRELSAKYSAVLEVVAPFARTGDKPPVPLSVTASCELNGRCSKGEHPLIEFVPLDVGSGDKDVQKKFPGAKTGPIEILAKAEQQDATPNNRANLLSLWPFGRENIKELELHASSCGHHPKGAECCRDAFVLVRVYRDEQWELVLKIPPLKKSSYGKSGSVDGTESSRASTTEYLSGAKTGTESKENTTVGKESSSSTIYDGHTSTTKSTGKEGDQTSTTNFSGSLLQKETKEEQDKDPTTRFSVRPQLTLKRNGLELPFSQTLNQILDIAHSFEELVEFIKKLTEVVKVGWSASVEIAILQGSLTGKWGVRPSATEDSEGFKWVSSYFDLSFDLVLASAELKLMFGIEAKSPAFWMWAEGALAEATAKVELDVTGEVKGKHTWNMSGALSEKDDEQLALDGVFKVELYGKLQATALGVSVGTQLGAEGGVNLHFNIRRAPFHIPWSFSREATVVYAAFYLPFKSRPSPRHETDVWDEAKDCRKGVLFG